MPTTNARFMLTVPDDMAKRAAALKKDTYYDKPYAEMYRQLIQLGMEILESQKSEGKSVHEATVYEGGHAFRDCPIHHEVGIT